VQRGGLDAVAHLRHHHRDQDLLLARVGDADHVGLLDITVAQEDLLDLQRGHVDPPGLDHLLDAAAEAQAPVGPDEPEIAGEQEALRVEGRRVALRVLVVARRQAAADQDLADLAVRQRAPALAVHHADLHPGG
jgi:hypothetical protein